MARVACALLLIAAAVAASPASLSWYKLSTVEEQAQYTFEHYLTEFGKQYSAEERNLRKRLFDESLKEVLIHNSGSFTYTKGINKFSDMTAEEKGAFLGYNKALSHSMQFAEESPESLMPISALPDAVDWRQKGVVSAIKNQGQCGSCWAFATTETLESHVAINTGKLLDLAPQQLVSCAPNPDQCGGTGGCEGSIAEVAYDYLKTEGQAEESKYPYQARDSKCKYDKSMAAAKCDGYTKLAANNYTAVMNGIANKGPLAIAVQASTWFSYSGGIFPADHCSKSNTDIDHAVQLVGYGTDNGNDYWIVRNSWGNWGEEGYIRLERSSNPPCNPDTTPADGTGCKGGPKKVTVCGTCGILYDTCYPTGAGLA